MVVLNCYGKIDRICISKKLGLYISNLLDSEDNNWKVDLEKQLKLAQDVDTIYQEYLGTKYPCAIFDLYHKVFPDRTVPEQFTEVDYADLASRMICISLDYNYDDMPLGGWDTNCFDGRLCEDDYTEKIINFLNFLTYEKSSEDGFPGLVPQWVYSSNHDEIDHFRIFWGGEDAELFICSLKKWGNVIDSFLVSADRYLMFDYLVDSIYKDAEYNTYHLMKDFSLCQMLLENKKEAELDTKLKAFLPDEMDELDKDDCAKLLRQLRNKIAHGDFMAFEEKVEEYAIRFMDGNFNFDYSEFSRKNWVIIHVCCLLDKVLRKIICMILYDTDALMKIKND